MKAWFVVLPIAIAAPVAATAQTSAAEDARAAQLQCELAGICGDLAVEEADREKQEIDGVDSRGLPSLGKLMAASKASSTRPQTASRPATARPEAPAKAQVTRTASRKVAPDPGRAAPTAKTRIVSPGAAAADVPESLARRAPLFVTFALNSAKLTPESATEVRSFAKALATISAAGMNKRYRIEGHTDSSGDPAFNRKLSEERAAAVRAALLAAGVDASVIEVAGLGSDQPIDGVEKSNPMNRRVEAVEIK
jgi:OmpA-OmpF porin, OOP family